MSSEGQAVEDVEEPASDEPVTPPVDRRAASGSQNAHQDVRDDAPSWWHRDHPTFAALSGFFTGLLFVLLIPAVYVGVLSLFLSNDRVESLFPFVLVTLAVPLALVVNHRTRRFGTYFWIGILLTAVVVVGVAAVVLWYLVDHQG